MSERDQKTYRYLEVFEPEFNTAYKTLDIETEVRKKPNTEKDTHIKDTSIADKDSQKSSKCSATTVLHL